MQKSSKVVLLEPRAYADAQEVADHLNNKRAVVVNLQRIQRDQGKRIVDFLSGTVYAIVETSKKLGQIFSYVPLQTSMFPEILLVLVSMRSMKKRGGNVLWT